MMALRLPVLEYYLKRVIKGLGLFILIYMGIVTAITLITAVTIGAFTPGTVIIGTDEGTMQMNGQEMAFGIAAFIACWSLFREEIHFFIQHGVSRRTAFIGFVLQWVLASLLFSVSLVFIFALWFYLVDFLPSIANTNITDIFQELYRLRLAQMGTVAGYGINILFTWALFFAAGMLGYCVSSLLYRMEKIGKTVLGVIVGLFAFSLPFLNRATNGGLLRIGRWMLERFLGDMENPNPWNAIVFFFILAVIALCASWLLVRRCRLKK